MQKYLVVKIRFRSKFSLLNRIFTTKVLCVYEHYTVLNRFILTCCIFSTSSHISGDQGRPTELHSTFES